MLKDRFLRNMLIVSVAAAIVMPICTGIFLYLSCQRILVASAEDEAIRIGTHLREDILPGESELKRGVVPGDSTMKVIRDFRLMKMKIFAPSGEILYSTDPREIGKANREGYFHDIVARGKSYAELIDEDDKSLEGQKMDADVVETYIPIMRNGLFLGAFEIYLDITGRKKSVDMLVLQSYALVFLAASGFMLVVVVTLKQGSREIEGRKRAEAETRRLNEELELQVAQRTAELLAAQEELVRKEKLATLGQLSGSVGHELRNPLGVMANAVYFLNMVLADADETTREYLGIIRKEIDTSQRIIGDLLDFARTKPPQTQDVAPRALVDECIGRCEMPANIDLRAHLPDSLPTVHVDPLQMEQVLHNLITNAVQAMPLGGALTIAARRVSSDTGAAPCGGPEMGGHAGPPLQDLIEISVTDTGEGITADNQKKLFQPLFTTKSRGIGLGLVVSRNLVEANGGRIAVNSRYGEGTTFTVALPTTTGGSP